MSHPLLRVEDLEVTFPSRGGVVVPVRGVSFELGHGEVVGLVGESGSGKTLTGLSCLQLVRPPGQCKATSLELNGVDLLTASESTLRAMRGPEISMIAQDPLTSLHPSIPIGAQIADSLADHGVARGERHARVLEALASVGLPDPGSQARRYPHELSGGMRQRAMIALAVANNPALLIADEPTTALDATVQTQLLHLLADLRVRQKMTVLLITHNLGIVAGICDRVMVMYSGRIVESGRTADIFAEPTHPYTKALLEAVPLIDAPGHHLRGIPGSPPAPWDRPSGCAFHPRCGYRIERCLDNDPVLGPTLGSRVAACWVSQQCGHLPPSPMTPSLEVPSSGADMPPLQEANVITSGTLPIFDLEAVTRHFREGPVWRRGVVHALDDINLEVRQGESLGIVGESGSGKSTLIRLLALLDRPTSGCIRFQGSNLGGLHGEDLRKFRRSVQIVFQDPYSSLDPRYTVAQSIREALRAHGTCTRREETARVRELLERVGVSAGFADRYPSEMSGGQRQRVCIARALAPEPDVLLADEPVSALDVSIQAQVIDLFKDLRRENKLTLVMVAHDLALIQEISSRIVTLYLGEIMEEAPAQAYGRRPMHPYSFALARATPDPGRVGKLPPILAGGEPPSPLHPPSGCRFHTRCFNAERRCTLEKPPLTSPDGSTHRFACFYPVTEKERLEVTHYDNAQPEVLRGSAIQSTRLSRGG